MTRYAISLFLWGSVLLLLAVGAWRSTTADAHTVSAVGIVNLNSNLCMDVLNASLDNGASVIQYNCHGGGNEKWDIVDKGGGWHEIKNKLSGLCLDVPYGSHAALVQLWQYTCNSSPAQRFTFPTAGYGTMINQESQLCIEVYNASTAPLEHVIQYPCWSPVTNNQKWSSRQYTSVFALLYEPVGDASNSAQLNCGWHTNCADGTYPDPTPRNGTDWQFPNNVKTDTYFRVRLTDSGSVGSAGYVTIRNYDIGCNSTTADIYDRWGNFLGREVFTHTDPPQGYTLPYNVNLSSGSSGVNTSARTGNYSWPDPLGCSTTGPHVHVEHINSGGWTWSKGTAIPEESSCHGCGATASIWTRWIFSYYFSR